MKRVPLPGSFTKSVGNANRGQAHLSSRRKRGGGKWLGCGMARRGGVKEWASLRRALAQWTMEVVLPSLLPGLSVPEVQDLDQLDERMETHMKPWNEQIKAEGRAEG